MIGEGAFYWNGPWTKASEAGKVEYVYHSDPLPVREIAPFRQEFIDAGLYFSFSSAMPGQVILSWVTDQKDEPLPTSSIEEVLRYASENPWHSRIYGGKESDAVWEDPSEWESEGEPPDYVRDIASRLPEEQRPGFLENIRKSLLHEPAEPFPQGAVPEHIQLYPFQEAGIQYAMDKEGVIIGDEMGLGKTMQAFGVANLSGARRVLVIAPNSLVPHWAIQAESLLTNPMPIYTPNHGKNKISPENWRIGPNDEGFVVLNYEAVSKYGNVLRQGVWDLMVLDEAHTIRNDNPRTRAIIGSSAEENKLDPIPSRKRIALTGTLVPDRPEQMYTVLHYARPDLFPMNRRSEFARRYQGFEKSTSPHMKDAYYAAENQALIRGTCYVGRTKDECLPDLPPKNRLTYTLPEMTDILTSIKEGHGGYTQEDSAAEEKLLEAERILVTGMRDALRSGQITPNKVRLPLISAYRKATGAAKRKRVGNMIIEMAKDGRPIVVFGHHRDFLNTLHKQLANAGIDVIRADGNNANTRYKNAANFEAGQGQVLLGSFHTTGTGLTLVRAKDIVMGEMDWTPGNLLQAEDRLHRIGQDREVNVTYPLLQGSIDGRVSEALLDKLNTIQHTTGISESSLLSNSQGIKASVLNAIFELDEEEEIFTPENVSEIEGVLDEEDNDAPIKEARQRMKPGKRSVNPFIPGAGSAKGESGQSPKVMVRDPGSTAPVHETLMQTREREMKFYATDMGYRDMNHAVSALGITISGNATDPELIIIDIHAKLQDAWSKSQGDSSPSDSDSVPNVRSRTMNLPREDDTIIENAIQQKRSSSRPSSTGPSALSGNPVNTIVKL